MNECNHLEKYGELTGCCDSICPFCKGDLCMHEYEDLLICKASLKQEITEQQEGNGK
jgi:hypothetical protein